MEVIRNIERLDPKRFVRPVMTIGNFDGCHTGHQQIFQRVREHAARTGGVSVVYTFHPHPASVIKGITPQLIFTLEEKIDAVRCLGMDFLVIAPFNREVADTSPEKFVRDIVVKRINARGVVVGHDFAFGRKGAGDIPFLQQSGQKNGFFVECVDPVMFDGDVVSSTRIRRLILSGDVAGAARLMKTPYRIHGPVVHGMARGRELGFPTANINTNKELLPAYGVYAVHLCLGARVFEGVVNIGNNPTFGDMGTSIEAFIFDLDEDIYGHDLTIEFVDHIRGEVKFADKQYLIEQIEADCTKAREILRERKAREDLRHL